MIEATLGVTIGLLGGGFLVLVLNRLSLPAGLHPAFVVAAAISLFALAQTLGASSPSITPKALKRSSRSPAFATCASCGASVSRFTVARISNICSTSSRSVKA